MAEVFGRLYGTKFRSKTGTVTASSLCGDGRVIGIYFGAEWCLPCREFLPKLVKFYEECSNSKHMMFDVIFISLDKTEEDFEKCYAKMPWLTTDEYNLNAQQELKEHLNVFGIPHLLIYDGKTGEMLTEHGVSEITNDPAGKFYPWHERDFAELMEIGELVNANGYECKFSSLKDCIKGYYFAASWSDPSKIFTKKLIKAYESVRKEGHKFQVIYVSMDKDEKSFKKQLKTMPWLAFPYGDRRKGRVQFDYGVMGVPKLIIVDQENRVITTDGRGSVSTDPFGLEFPWRPKPYTELQPDTVGYLNDSKCLVVFAPSVQRETMIESIREISNEQLDKGYDRDLQFYFACTDGEYSQTVKMFLKFMKIKKPSYPLVLVTFLQQSAYFPMEFDSEQELSEEVIRHFVDEFLAGKIERVVVNHDNSLNSSGASKD